MKSLSPLKIIRKNVDQYEVGKYYIKSEFDRIFSGDSDMRKKIENTVDIFTEDNYWRMLESLSFTYRLNSMYWLVGDDKYSWSLEKWRISDISLTGINPEIDKITYSKKVDRNPLKFKKYLTKHFAKNPKEMPSFLEQFRNFNIKVIYPRLFVKEEGGKIFIIDGSNRLMNFAQSGIENATVYVARETNPKGKMRIGDSTFILLRMLYKKADSKSRESILNTIEVLLKETTGGKKAIQAYWIGDLYNKEVRKAGKKLLSKQLN